MKHLQKLEKFFHGYVTVVALASGFFVAIMSMSAAQPNQAFASKSFGGLVTETVKEKEECDKDGKNCKKCPKHMKLNDFSDNGKAIGLYTTATTKKYDYQVFDQAGKYLLGNRESTANSECDTVYKVYRIISAGTSK